MRAAGSDQQDQGQIQGEHHDLRDTGAHADPDADRHPDETRDPDQDEHAQHREESEARDAQRLRDRCLTDQESRGVPEREASG